MPIERPESNLTRRPDGQMSADRGHDRLVPGRRGAVARDPEDQDSPPEAAGRRRPRAARGLALGLTGGPFHPGTLSIDEAPRSPVRGRVAMAIMALVLAALGWSYFGRLASYTSADGKIQVVGRTRVVEALAPGKVKTIRVNDGDTVEAASVLVELDPTDALAARTILDQKLIDLRAENLRLKTEIVAARADPVKPDTKIAWGADMPAAVRQREDGVGHADLAELGSQIATLASQKQALAATQQKFVANVAAQKSLIVVTQENLTMVQDLVKGGYNSQAKYLDVKAQLDDQQVTQTSYEGGLENAKQAILMVESQVLKTRETFVTTATQALTTNEEAIVDLTQQLIKADQKLANMTLRSPAAGIVHASAVTTIDQVVKPREELMQIVPRDEPLEIQAYLSNKDIGFVQKGDPATIKLTAFAYGTYGSIDGTVTEIASDALSRGGKPALQSSSLDGNYLASTDAQKTADLQFPITVRAARSTMTVGGKEIPLVPGMKVDVEILTENRRAIDYIISPIKELFSTAGHERS